MLVRTDAAGATHAFIAHLAQAGVEYSLGFACDEKVQAAVLAVPENGWTPAYNADGEVRDGAWVAEIERHEAPWIRVEVKDLHHRAVAAAWLKLRAA